MNQKVMIFYLCMHKKSGRKLFVLILGIMAMYITGTSILNPVSVWAGKLDLSEKQTEKGVLPFGPQVGTDDIQAGAVTSPKLRNDAVTNAKIANDAVTSENIAKDAVTPDKIAGVSKLVFTSCTLDFGPIPAHSNKGLGCSVVGADVGDLVMVTPQGKGTTFILLRDAYVSSDGTVMITVENVNQDSGIQINPYPTKYAIIVYRP